MQSANDVQLGRPQFKGFASFLYDLIQVELKSVRIALLPRKRAKVTAQDAVVRIVNVPVDDVTGPVAGLALAHDLGDGADGVQVLRLEQAKRVTLRDSFPGSDFVVDVLQPASLDQEMHNKDLAEGGEPSKRLVVTPEGRLTCDLSVTAS